MSKLDGISIQLHISGSQINMYTKKMSNIGTQKNHLLPYVLNEKLINKISKISKNDIAIRGELIISRKDFEEFKDPFN